MEKQSQRTHAHEYTRGSRLLCFDWQRTFASSGYHSCLVLCCNGDRAGLKPVVQNLNGSLSGERNAGPSLLAYCVSTGNGPLRRVGTTRVSCYAVMATGQV